MRIRPPNRPAPSHRRGEWPTHQIRCNRVSLSSAAYWRGAGERTCGTDVLVDHDAPTWREQAEQMVGGEGARLEGRTGGAGRGRLAPFVDQPRSGREVAAK